MPSGFTVTRLSITPIKGLLLHHPEALDLTAHGAVGDRAFYLVDEQGGIQSCTAHAGLFGLRATYDAASRSLEVSRDGRVLVGGYVEAGAAIETDLWGIRDITADVVADPVWSDFFSEVVGRRVHLAQARESAYDVAPVTVIGAASVDELARRSDLPDVDARRFRMLIEFAGGEPHVEDSWDGRLLEVGDAVLRGGGPVKRCAATTRDPDTGTVDLQTLRLITKYRGRHDFGFGPGANFGVYASVVEPGTIAVGDTVTVEPGA